MNEGEDGEIKGDNVVGRDVMATESIAQRMDGKLKGDDEEGKNSVTGTRGKRFFVEGS